MASHRPDARQPHKSRGRSDPNIVYVGSGEGMPRPDLSTGDGMYKSSDAGRTWTHLGLRDGQQIPQIVVDPRNPNRLFVAVLEHPYVANEERGIFRSLDCGQTFEKVLYNDENSGGIFRSDNGGETWRRRGVAGFEVALISGCHIIGSWSATVI